MFAEEMASFPTTDGCPPLFKGEDSLFLSLFLQLREGGGLREAHGHGWWPGWDLRSDLTEELRSPWHAAHPRGLGSNPDRAERREAWPVLLGAGHSCFLAHPLALGPASIPAFPSGSLPPGPTHLSPFHELRQASYVRKFLGVHFNKT